MNYETLEFKLIFHFYQINLLTKAVIQSRVLAMSAIEPDPEIGSPSLRKLPFSTKSKTRVNLQKKQYF